LTGFSNFTDIQANLPGVNVGTLDWGDYDQDGDLDLLLCGSMGTVHNSITQVFRNEHGFFTDINATLPGVLRGFANWLDIDSDGFLDIILGGFMDYPGRAVKLFKNVNGNYFTEIPEADLPALAYVSFSAGDYNNDGYPDFILSGINENNDTLTALYRNCYGPDTVFMNTLPSVPINLLATQTPAGVNLQWDKSTDNTTPQNTLSYNIFVSHYPDSLFVVSPMADLATGFRKIPQSGNTSLNNFWHIDSLQPGTYYWSVQVIDNSFAGSPFAPVQTFTIGSPIPASVTISGDSVGNGETSCFNATQTITVAGNGTSFVVQPGGSATIIAGQNIIFLPSVQVEEGGYVHGYITTSGEYCLQTTPPMVKSGSVEGNPEITTTGSEQPGEMTVKAWPNPTPGIISLFVAAPGSEQVQVNVLNLFGEKVYARAITVNENHTLSLENLPPGIYLIRVVRGTNSTVLKAIRN